MNYRALLLLHVSAAIASPVLFSLRASRAWRGLDPAVGWLKVTPHAVDTLLLIAGLSLATSIRQLPFQADWVTAKLYALIVYIVLGHIAVRRARANWMRRLCWAAALCVLAYIYAVALTGDPTPFL